MSNWWIRPGWRPFAVAVLLVAACQRPVLGQTTVTTLDSTGDVGRWASLGIGGDGRPLVSYYDATLGDLKAAHCANAACTSATLSTIASVGDVGKHSALAIGADGRGIVAYYDATSQRTMVAHCDDADCTTSTRTALEDREVLSRIGIGVGPDGRALIAYLILTPSPVLHVAHCNDVTCTSSTISEFSALSFPGDAAVAFGPDGFGRIAYTGNTGGPFPDGLEALVRCTNTACSAATVGLERNADAVLVGSVGYARSAIVMGADGNPFRSFTVYSTAPPPAGSQLFVAYGPASNPSPTWHEIPFVGGVASSLANGADGRPWVAFSYGPEVRLRQCTDDQCTAFVESCVAQATSELSLARGADDRPVIAFFDPVGSDLGVLHGPAACVPYALSIADGTVDESAGVAVFDVTLSRPFFSSTDVTWAVDLVPGTAAPGLDFGAATVTGIPSLGLHGSVTVPIVQDALDEPDQETFVVRIANPPAGVGLADAEANGAIVDDDGPVSVSAGACRVVEGNSGTGPCLLDVTLAAASGQTVSVSYATANGTAQAGGDYLAASGTVTFVPGDLVETVTVSVIGDTSVELDETFFINLSNPVNATIGDGQGEGSIVDDDAPSLSSLELTHGTTIRADLAADPGPIADEDVYRLAQSPYSSWEVVVDEASGDVAPGFVLDRLAEDNLTVLQTAAPIGIGSAKALRWERRSSLAETRHHVRVRSASCSTDCGPDDIYRLRTYETTGRVPRYNNSATQVTVLILQNANGEPIQAHADFWAADGSLAATVPITLAAHGVGVVNTSTVPGLAGTSGSITVTHDGPYGALAGKAVAVEPATGFSFDSPLTYRPR